MSEMNAYSKPGNLSLAHAFIYKFIVIIVLRSSDSVSNKNMLLTSIHYPLSKTSRWQDTSGNGGPLMPVPV